jgi:hypothetical protein
MEHKEDHRDEGYEPIHQQVMGPNADLTTKNKVPKFKYDGGNPAQFNRDFLSCVATAYGVRDAYLWDEDKELRPDEERKDTVASLVLRQYLSDKVLKMVMIGQPTRASSIYKVLDAVFLKSDIRTKAQVSRELSMCDMAMGETLQDFIARLNDLMEESQMMGEPITDNQRMITLATRLKEPWREIADNLIDREPDLTYTLLMQHLMQRLRSDPDGRRPERAFMSTTGGGSRGRGGRQSSGGGRGTGGEGGEDTAVDEAREDQMTGEGGMRGKEEGMGLGGEVREEADQHQMLVSTVGNKDIGGGTVQNLQGATTVETSGILPENVHQMDKSKLGFQWCKGNSSIRGKGMKQRRNLHIWLSNYTKTLKKEYFNWMVPRHCIWWMNLFIWRVKGQ